MKSLKNYFIVFCLLCSTSAWSQTANPQAVQTEHEMATQSRLATSILGGNGSNAGGVTVQTDEFSGAETYALAIPVPPGRGSITPSLSLNYNSQRKNPNSWVGYGWDLDVGSISRLPALDGLVRYEDGIDFEVRLSGQAETLTRMSTHLEGDYPTAANDDYVTYNHAYADVYETKIESSFTKYFYLRQSYNGGRPESWVALDKNGIYYVFEQREVAFAADPTRLGENRISRWLLTTVIDPNNNNMRVRYDADGVIQQLEYQDITVHFDVGFLSPSLTDQRYYPSFREGSLPRGQLSKVLKEISILSGAEVLQRYRLSYETTPYRRVRQLVRIQQLGPRDDQSLPPVTFDYYPENDLSFNTEETAYTIQPSEFGIQGAMTGGQISTFVDMNGDGLVDHLTAHDGYFDVFYNNGNNFIRNTSSRWDDPFPCDDAIVRESGRIVFREDDCRRLIYDYTTGGEDSHQRLYLMDMNGDGLPDRVQKRIIRSYDTADETAYYRIAFNNGHGWSRVEDWEDPHHGFDAGLSDKRQNFIDMNGDGLPDRVVGGDEQDYFLIYYNNGGGFNHTPARWEDPLARSGHSSRGKLYDFDGENQFLFTRDFNGDGLPDRVLRTELFDRSGTSVGMGFMIFLNTGNGWAMPMLEPGTTDRVLPDGYGVLILLDEVQDEDSRGMINSQHDLMDINNDGYLDRVEGDTDTGVIRVWFYQGMLAGNIAGRFSNPIELSDPLAANQVEYRVADDPTHSHILVAFPKTWPARGVLNADDGDGHHFTWLMDVDGDGFPDRMAIKVIHSGVIDPAPHSSPRAILTGTEMHYEVHPLNVNSVHFADAPTFWNNQSVNQPVGILKSVQSGQGGKIALEYQPSTWCWDNHSDSDHRFLPFPLYVVHNVYSQDYTTPYSSVRSLDPPLPPDPRRYPGMRVTHYRFRGGNYFIRYAQKLNPTDPEDSRLSRARVARFNGFHEVTKTIEPELGESWLPLTTTTFYTQANGDANPIPLHFIHPLFRRTSEYFGHYALSGKPYLQVVNEGDREVSRENYYYDINAATTDNFECIEDPVLHVLPCYPRLISHQKIIHEAVGGDRRSNVRYRYDALGNLLGESHWNGTDLLVETTSEYYPSSRFSDRIRNRVRYQTKKGPGGTIYRSKFFDYDGRGNPSLESFYQDDAGASRLNITKTFYPNGNLQSLTDVDGVRKEMEYGSSNIFPVRETLIGSSGIRLSTSRTFLRLNGEVSSETSPQGITTGSRYDVFGRPEESFVIDRSGRETTLKRMSYEFVSQTVNFWPDIILQKIQSWEYKPDFPSETRPAQIAYSDSGGMTLQSCALSERGNYRMTFSRVANGGRENRKFDPVFADNCDFREMIPSDLRMYRSQSDLQGRAIYVEAPPSDSGSALGSVSISYATDPAGHVIKNILNPRGFHFIEEYDAQDRLVRKTDALGSVMEYDYNPVGDLLRVRNEGRLLTRLDYDVMGRKTDMYDADMGHWQYFYDTAGRLDHQQDNAGQVVKNYYDDLSRVWKKDFKRSDGSLEKYEMYTFDCGESGYDVLPGELYQVREFSADDHLLRRTRFSYADSFRRGDKTSREIPGVGEFHQETQYDVLGRMLQTQYPGGYKLKQEYMLNGGPLRTCGTRCEGPDAEVYYRLDPSSSFDVYGSLLEEYFGNGVFSHYDYFPNSKRLQKKESKRGRDVYFSRAYTYDETANVLSLNDLIHSQGSAGLVSVSYDPLDRLTQFQHEGSTRVDRMDYDRQGNVLKNTASYGENLYQYTSPKPHAVTQIGDQHFDYDDNGNMISDPYRHMTYNTQNQLTQVTMQNGDIVRYEYDYAGSRVAKRIEKHLPDHRVERKVVYYLGDVLEVRDGGLILNIFATGRRIATRTLGSLSSLTGAAGGTLIDHGIDPNFCGTQLLPYLMIIMTLLMVASLRPMPALVGAQFIAPYKTVGRDKSRPYVVIYNLWKSWTETIREAVFSYQTRRWLKTFMLFMIFLMQFQQLTLAHADEGIPLSPTSDADYFYYNHDDHLGSSALLTEGKMSARHSGLVYNRGDLLQRFEYAPFGHETFALNPNLNFDPSYTGQHYDIETGLYYYKARYYNPLLGRFIQPDTVIPNAKNLQDYNRYTYVNNNPLKYVDPSGHFWGMFRRIMGAFFAALISAFIMVTATYALGPVGAAFAAMIVGTVVNAVISGQEVTPQGFLMNAVITLATAGVLQAYSGPSLEAIMKVVGLGLSIKTEGWRGLVTFGAASAGGALGGYVGNNQLQKNIKIGEDQLSLGIGSRDLTMEDVEKSLNNLSNGGYAPLENPDLNEMTPTVGKTLFMKGKISISHDLPYDTNTGSITGGEAFEDGTIHINARLDINMLDEVLGHEVNHFIWSLRGLSPHTISSEFSSRRIQMYIRRVHVDYDVQMKELLEHPGYTDYARP